MNLQSHIPSSSYAIDPKLPAYSPVRGMSDESNILAKLIENIYYDRRDPRSLAIIAFDNSAAWKKALGELDEIQRKCTTNNWDNAGSAKIESQTIESAQELIERMPNYLPLPKISPEPDGNINLEWYVDKDFVFEISVDRNKNLYYAGRLRGQKMSGRKEISGAFPEVLEDHLRQFINR